MDVEAAFPAGGQPAELVQQAEGLLDDVAQPAEALDVLAAAAGDDRLGPPVAAGFTEGVAVVAFVGQQHREATSWPAGPSGDGWDGVEQVDGLADVGHVRAGREYLQRGAPTIADQVMLAAGLAAVDRRRTCTGTPLFASM